MLLAEALLPQLPGATVGALTLQLLGLQRFALVWDDLYISRALGAVAMLPVALAAVLAGPRAMLTQLAAPASVAPLAGTAAVGYGSTMALPFPFVYLCIPLVAGALLLPLAASLALALEVVIVVTVATSIGLHAPTDGGWRQLLIYSAAIAAVLPAQFLTVAVARQRTLSATLAALNSATVDLTSFIDNGGIHRAVNRAHESYFGLQRKHILGRHIGEVLPRGHYKALVEPNVARAMAGETVNFTAEIDYPGRGVRTMDLTYQPALDAHGVRLGVILNAHDITALTATQRDLNNHSQACARRMETWSNLCESHPTTCASR